MVTGTREVAHLIIAASTLLSKAMDTDFTTTKLLDDVITPDTQSHFYFWHETHKVQQDDTQVRCVSHTYPLLSQSC